MQGRSEGARKSHVGHYFVTYETVLSSDYKIITYDYAMAAAKAFAPLSPAFNFVYVSGDGVCLIFYRLPVHIPRLTISSTTNHGPRSTANLAASRRCSLVSRAKLKRRCWLRDPNIQDYASGTYVRRPSTKPKIP